MRYRSAGLGIVLFFCVAAGTGQAGDSQNRFKSYNPLLSCGDFVELRQGPETIEKTAAFWWLIGFVSGVNNGLPETFDITGDTGLFDSLQWAVDYCAANPEAPLEDAAQSLVRHLYPNRIPEAPE